MADNTDTKVSASGKDNRKLLIGGGALIVVLLCVVGYMGWRLAQPVEQPPNPENDISQRSVLVNEDNVEEIVREMQNAPTERPGSYEVSMTMDWNFPDGTSVSPDAFVENVTNNTNDVYFDLLLDDTNEVIYESPIIPRGAHLTEFALDKDLDPGTYPAVVEYHLVDAEQRTLGTLSMLVTIHVNG